MVKSAIKTGARLKSLVSSYYRDLSEGEIARSIQSTIFKRLLIILLVFFAVPIGFLSWRLIVHEEAAIHERTLTQLQTVADGVEAQLLEFLNYIKGRTQDFSSDGFIRDAVAEIIRQPDGNQEMITALNRHLAVNKQPIIPECEETFVTNLSGVVIASSQAANLGSNYARAEFFGRGQTETYISDVFFDDLNGRNSWVVSTPLTDKVTHELSGVLINRIRIETLSDITQGRRAAAMGAKTYPSMPGQAGEIYLVNRDRLMITESEYGEDAILNQVADTWAVWMALDEGREMVGDYESYHGGRISGATMIIDEPGWVLVTEMDFGEAFAPVVQLRNKILAIVGALIVGLAGMILFLAQRIVIPIGRIVRANQALVEGDEFAAFISESVIPSNELGEVIRSRNLMLARLQEREQQRMRKLSQIVEQMSDSVVITDKEGSIEYVNPAFESITGYGEQEALGNKPWLLKSGEHDDVTYKRFWKTIFSGRDYKGVLISKRKNGELFYEERHVTPILAATGEITHYVSISRDITKRVEAEEALVESESRYHAITETATDAIITVDEKSNITLANPAVERQFGYNPEELIGQPLTILMQPEDGKRHMAGLNRYLETGNRTIDWEAVETVGLHKDGHAFPVEISFGQLTTDGGRSFVGIIRDVSERKRGEEEIRQSHQNRAVLNRLLQISLEDISLEEMLEQTIDHLISIPWLALESEGSIFLVEDDPAVLVLKAQRNLPDQLLAMCARIPFGRCVCGRAASSGKIEFLDHVDKRHDNEYEGMTAHGHYCVPIKSAGKLLGVLNLSVMAGHHRDEKEEEFLLAAADVLAGIIERQQAEEVWRRYAAIVNTSTNFLTLINRDCVYEAVNDAYCRAHGKSRDEIIGHKVADIWGQEVFEEVIEEYLSRCFKGEKVQYEARFGFDYPTKHYFDVTYYPYYDEESKVTHAIVVTSDITDRKRTEEALQVEASYVEMLQAVTAAANGATCFEDAVRVALEHVCRHTGWPVGHVYLPDEEQDGRLVPSDIWYLKEPERFKTFMEVTAKAKFTKGAGLPGRVLATGEPAWIKDLAKDKNFFRTKMAKDIGVQSGFAFPALIGSEVVAVLEFFAEQPAEPDEKLLAIISHIGTEVGRALERSAAVEALRNIAAGVSAKTGKAFFTSLVEHLAKALGSDYAFVGELSGPKKRQIKTVAVYGNGKMQENFKYNLKGTPCNEALTSGIICLYPEGVQRLFPDDKLLIEMGIEAYFGMPLLDSQGTAVGILVVCHRRPMSKETLIESTLQIFATRVTAELERQAAEEQLRKAHAGLEMRVEERTAELAESSRKYRHLFEHAHDAIFIVDPETRQIMDVNENAVRRLGYTRQELLKLTIDDLAAPESLIDNDHMLEELGESGNVIFEHLHQRKDGSTFPVEISSRIIQVGDQPVIQSFVRDISERKEAEEHLRKLSLAVEQSPATVVITDTAGKIEYVNSQFTATTGYSAEEAFGQNPSILSSGQQPKEFYRKMWETITSGETWQGEFCNRKKNGEIYWESAIISPIIADDGRVTHFVAVKEDITTRKATEAERERLVEELENKNQDLQQILHISSHDLRSPLVSIKGFSSILDKAMGKLGSLITGKNGKSPAEVSQELNPILSKEIPAALDHILASTDKMESLLSGLLRLSRLGQAGMNITKLDMNELLAGITKSIEFLIKKAQVQLEIGELPPSRGDAILIGQVFSNLLGNAVKYLNKERQGVIRISGEKLPGSTVYVVEDNGIGIEPDYQQKVFDLYQRINPSVGNGEGLGLTITRKILDRHHGRIWLESQPGKGSKFFVELPD